MNYCLVGNGKMGQAIDLVAAARGHRRVAVFDSSNGLAAAAGGAADVAFEFSRPEAAAGNVETLLRSGVSVVCGTTGWEPGAQVDRALSEGGAGLIVAPNFSIGVNLFFRLAGAAAALFGPVGGQQPYILETHHRGKLDAPSGTAVRLAGILLENDSRLRGVRHGEPARPAAGDELQVVSLRVGAETGTHEVGFDGEHDSVTLRHRARSRSGFALGAVQAAEWLMGRPGRHVFDAVIENLIESAGAASREGEST